MCERKIRVKRRSILYLVFCVVILFMAFTPLSRAEFDPESISTPYFLLMDADTGTVIYHKQGDTQFYPASTTKILTCIIALEKTTDLDETFSVGPVTDRGSCMGIREGEKLSMRDLLYGLMLVSGNDAADAIAHKLAGGRSEFAAIMNEKAAEIGMTKSHFMNANGLHNEEHVSTAYDMALLARYAMQNETFRKIVSTEQYTTSPTSKKSNGYTLTNSNRLIATGNGKANIEYEYATGIKTGNTIQSGYCLVASATKNDRNLILVILGDNEYEVASEYRFKNAKSIFEWAFEKLETASAADLGMQTQFTVQVSDASLSDAGSGMLSIVADLSTSSVSMLSDDIAAIKADPSLVTVTIQDADSVKAPVKQGDVIGTVVYSYKGFTFLTADLVASRDVADLATQTTGPEPTLEIIDNEEKSGSWLLVWILLAVLIIVVVLIIMLIMSKKSGRIRARRRGYYVTRKR